MTNSILRNKETRDVNRALWSKAISESRLMLAGMGLILFTFCWLRVWIVGIVPMPNFETILKQVPQIEQFLPVDISQLVTYNGRITLTFEELIVVMSFAIWSIGRGSDVVSGELSRGTMEMVLGQPVSRSAFFWSKAIVALVGLLILSTLVWLGIYVGIRFTTIPKPIPLPGIGPAASLVADVPTVRVPLSTEVHPRTFVLPTVNLFSLGVFLFGLSTLFSSLDRYRWRTIGWSSGCFAVAIIFKIVALADPRLSWLRAFTFLTAYEPQRVVQIATEDPDRLWSLWITDVPAHATHLGPAGMNLFLAGSGMLSLVLASRIFKARDLPAPC